MFQDVISFAALKTNIKKTYILEKNLFKYDKRKKVSVSVKFRFISKLVINFSVGMAWVYFWH